MIYHFAILAKERTSSQGRGHLVARYGPNAYRVECTGSQSGHIEPRARPFCAVPGQAARDPRPSPKLWKPHHSATFACGGQAIVHRTEAPTVCGPSLLPPRRSPLRLRVCGPEILTHTPPHSTHIQRTFNAHSTHIQRATKHA